MRGVGPSAAVVTAALLMVACSGARTVDLEPTTGIAATCEWSPDENVRGNDRWGNGADAMVFLQPAISAGATITSNKGEFDESPAVAAGEIQVVLNLLETAPAVARVEAQTKEEAYQEYVEAFDNPLITDGQGPDEVPLRISVWATETDNEIDVPFRSLMSAIEASPDVFVVVERVDLCIRDFMSNTITCGLPAEGPVDLLVFVGSDRSLASAADLVGDVGASQIELVDSQATLFEVAELLGVDLLDGLLNADDVSASVRISNVADPNALIAQLTQRFDQRDTGPSPTIVKPGQGCS